MNKIITISREFGSGGRGLGRRLSELLNIAYYDQEIITEIANQTDLAEQYVEHIIEQQQPIVAFPIHTSRSLCYAAPNPVVEQRQTVMREQTRIIREMAEKTDCVIVGRCGDYILRDFRPFRIFVYADLDHRVQRCMERRTKQEDYSTEVMKKKILSVDKNRSKYYEFYTEQKWGDCLNYDICINSSGRSIEGIAQLLLNAEKLMQ